MNPTPSVVIDSHPPERRRRTETLMCGCCCCCCCCLHTVGGLIVTELGRLAVPGDEVVVPPIDDLGEDETALRLRVMSILGRRIKKVNVQRYVHVPDSSSAAAEAV